MVTVTGDPLGGILAAIVFIPLGALLIFKPDLYLKFQIWQQKVFMGAKYIPSKKTILICRLLGAIFFIGGLLSLFLGLVGYGIIS